MEDTEEADHNGGTEQRRTNGKGQSSARATCPLAGMIVTNRRTYKPGPSSIGLYVRRSVTIIAAGVAGRRSHAMSVSSPFRAPLLRCSV